MFATRPRIAFYRIWVLSVLSTVLLTAAPRWKMQFYYDKSDAVLNLRDIQCPTAQRCIAAGVIEDKKGHETGTVVLTTDGGKQWITSEVRERPVSLFFLNESQGWMVTDHGVWSTQESGRNWKKLESLKGILRVHFLDASHGYAIGFPKAVYETTDGGDKWTKLPIVDSVDTDAKRTVFSYISFAGNHGGILGTVLEPDRSSEPLWTDPRPELRREREKTAVIIETTDGGKKWNTTTTPILGDPVALRLYPGGFGLLLLQFHNRFAVPSVVKKLAFGPGESQTIFSETDRAVTDLQVFPDGSAILAAIEPPGKSNMLPIPGKLKMLHSGNLRVWTDMDVDYRALAQRAVLAAPDAQHAWVATDTGMILTLLDGRAGTR